LEAEANVNEKKLFGVLVRVVGVLVVLHGISGLYKTAAEWWVFQALTIQNTFPPAVGPSVLYGFWQ